MTTYAYRGGHSKADIVCGCWLLSLYPVLVDSLWTVGAILHMLVEVVILVTVIFVDRFIFVFIMLVLIHFGIMALPYRHTHYALRGGLSNHGAYCGAFYIVGNYGAGNYSWTAGAALSFKLLMIIYHSNNKFYRRGFILL